jgi:enoyl-[acyl-carrier protein] reductase I
MLLEGKRVLIVGLANNRSLAWGIAQALHREGAKLAFTYMNGAIEKRVRPLAESLTANIVLQCDVQSDDEIKATFASLQEEWGGLDGVIHAVAYAERSDLSGRFSETTREGFRLALDVSAYSLIALANGARSLMSEGGSILTLTYLGSERAFPNYNVMGVAKAALESSVRYLALDLGKDKIRVNAISAGPVKTLAASGIANFSEMLGAVATRAPLGRNISIEDVGNVASFYLSDLAGAITGEITYVDAGYNIT